MRASFYQKRGATERRWVQNRQFSLEWKALIWIQRHCKFLFWNFSSHRILSQGIFWFTRTCPILQTYTRILSMVKMNRNWSLRDPTFKLTDWKRLWLMSRETIVKRPSNAPEKTPTIHQHICQHCSKKFWQASTLRDHVNFFHLGLKKYVCGECGKALETRQRLRWHVANNRKCSRSKNNIENR